MTVVQRSPEPGGREGAAPSVIQNCYAGGRATTSTGTDSLKLDSDPLGSQFLNDSANGLVRFAWIAPHVKSEHLRKRNRPTMTLLDRTALCRERRAEAERLVPRQSSDVGLPAGPAVRCIEGVQVTDQAPVEEVRVTLPGVLPPEGVGREVPDAVIFGGEPPTVQGEEATQSVVRDEHRRRRRADSTIPHGMHRLDSGHFAVEDSLDAIAEGMIAFRQKKVH